MLAFVAVPALLCSSCTKEENENENEENQDPTVGIWKENNRAYWVINADGSYTRIDSHRDNPSDYLDGMYEDVENGSWYWGTGKTTFSLERNGNTSIWTVSRADDNTMVFMDNWGDIHTFKKISTNNSKVEGKWRNT